MDLIIWQDAEEEASIHLDCCDYAKELYTEPFDDDFFANDD